MTTEPQIYLASNSPRRQELLRQLGITFDVLKLREAAGREWRILWTHFGDDKLAQEHGLRTLNDLEPLSLATTARLRLPEIFA